MGAAAMLLLGLAGCGQHRVVVRTAAPPAVPPSASTAPAGSGGPATESVAPAPSASPRGSGAKAHPRRQTRTAATKSAVASPSAGASAPATGSCVADGRHGYRPVPCASSAAYARVISRQMSCPEGTDLRIAIRRGGVDAGTACLRKLHGPHPGDPGGGGGTRIRVGDCVYVTSDGIARETACVPEGAANPHPPQFRVTAMVTVPTACPNGSDGWIVLTPPQTGFACVTRVSASDDHQDGNSQGSQ